MSWEYGPLLPGATNEGFNGVIYTDDFDDTNSTELSTHTSDQGDAWVRHSASGSNTCDIQSNKLSSVSSAGAVYYLAKTPASADYWVECTVTSSGNDTGGPIGRIDTSAATLYLVAWLSASGWSLYKYVAGTPSQIGSSVAVFSPATTPRVATLRMTGSLIEVVIDGVLVISQTDTDISAAGRAGIITSNFGTGENYNDWKFYDPAATGGVTNKTMTATALTTVATLSKLRALKSTITATAVSTTATLTKAATFVKALTATALSITESIDKAATKNLTATATAITATLTKVRDALRSLTASSGASATVSKTLARVMSASAAASATVRRSLDRVMSASSAAGATLTKGLAFARDLTATALTATGSMTRLTGLVRTLAATGISQTASFSRQIARHMSATRAPIATMSRLSGTTLTATALVTAATISQIRSLFKTLAASATTAAGTLSRQVARTLSGALALAATRQRVIAKRIEIIQVVYARLLKGTAKRLTASSTVLASLSRIKATLAQMAANLPVSASFQRSYSLIFVVSTSISASISRSMTKFMSATLIPVAMRVRTGIPRRITATSAITARVLRTQFRTLTASILTVLGTMTVELAAFAQALRGFVSIRLATGGNPRVMPALAAVRRRATGAVRMLWGKFFP